MSEYEKSVTIKEVKDFFEFAQLTGDEQSLSRWVIVPDVNRPGLELTGFYEHAEPKRIVILGDKEMAFIHTLSHEEQWERFDRLTDPWTPAIIVSKNHQLPEVLKELGMRKNFPIFSSPLPTFRLMVDVISYLDEKLAPSDNLHGVLMSVYGKGVLITGESGMGKSEIALELIRKGHVLVADDRVDVTRVHNTIIGRSPELLQGVLEIRGIGIIDIVKMFGASSTLEKMQIDFVVNLEHWNSDKEYARVGIEEDTFMNILDLDIPQILFPVKEGRNMAVLIESAVTDFTLKQMGIDSSKEFEQKVYDFIQKQNEENKREG